MSTKNRVQAFFLTANVLALVPISAQSAVPEWQIIPAESQLTFTGTQNGAPVSGEFKQFTGSIFVDPNDLKSSHIDIVVDINSLSASYADLKTTLASPDWFNVKLFPKAEYKSTQFVKTGEKTYQAIGTLTLRDKSEPVTLTFTAEQLAPNKGMVVGSTVIKRTLFGVGQGEWASTNQIKDEVTVSFKVMGVKK
ncbi:MAG: YceI family protein [Tatlockia sp.]|jgi:polyisoprenoid-binding protein YceI